MHDLELYPRIIGHARDDYSDTRARRSISGRGFGSPSCVRARRARGAKWMRLTRCKCSLPSIP
eukprot:3137064-Prymnesium_polylepis.1